jgi:hypothetical protein
LTSLESVYNHLLEDIVKYKKAPIDVKKLKLALTSAKKEMLKIIEEVGKTLEEQRRLQKPTD